MGMYCASWIFTGSFPSFTTFPTATPIGTVHRLLGGAFQSARTLPE